MLQFKRSGIAHILTIQRPERNNALNYALLKELHHAIEKAEDDPNCRMVVLQGQSNIFCSGMDFHELISWNFSEEKIRDWAVQYMALLKLISSTCNMVVAKIEGKVIAGGVGLVAASDYVLAAPETTFKLTETLWGLLPAMVTPYMIRRVGFQKAYALTFTAKTTSAKEAADLHLVDELSSDLNHSLDELSDRFKRLKSSTIAEMKSYFRKMSFIDPLVEKTAVNEITTLLQNGEIQKNIRDFVSHGALPWKT